MGDLVHPGNLRLPGFGHAHREHHDRAPVLALLGLDDEPVPFATGAHPAAVVAGLDADAADEQRQAFFGGKHRHRLGFFEPREERDVAVGAVGMLDVAVAGGDRHRRKYRHRRTGRERAHAAQHLVPAGLVDRLVEGGQKGHGNLLTGLFLARGAAEQPPVE